MFLKSILALTDLSVDGDKALARAGQIAVQHGAVLHLMVLSSGRQPQGQDAGTRLAQIASAMSLRLGLAVHAVEDLDGTRAAIVAQAAHAQLLVIPQGRRRDVLSSWFFGPDAIRYARDCRCPVLVARGAVRRRTRQIVVGMDFTLASEHRALLTCSLYRDAQVELFHAVSTVGERQLRQSEAAPDMLHSYRENRVGHARARLRRMVPSLQVHTVPVVWSARIGEPAQQLLSRQAWTGADLVVVGKRRRSAVADWLLGSTAHDVLAQSRCDVMVVPDSFTVSASRMPAQAAHETTHVRPGPQVAAAEGSAG